ncbi:GMC oxidoreductase [Ophiocordyceps camponoti-floridani]|uniref:GMC oxidoreductase n=1 Tax=Ophiocordyceps camponoti-floridani TaxID=2030778 RepID=A0A8H4VG90_9HYPO|nr:GMC oxidoreductase [Ophiocordyceps camponoti-floridani]
MKPSIILFILATAQLGYAAVWSRKFKGRCRKNRVLLPRHASYGKQSDCNMASSDSKPSQTTYDFIVCGGGTSGCVVAGRLAENPETTILIIEAGADNQELENVHMPAGAASLIGEDTDWNIESEPGTGINNRRIRLTRGKFLGGCSGCNGTLCIRGNNQDYDDWAMPGWSGADMFGYMKKAENFTSKDWFRSTKASHGYHGHLHTEPLPVRSITKLVAKSLESKGLSSDDDMVSHGENPNGWGYITMTVSNGIRTTGADFVTKKNRRNNITIVTKAYVDKVLMEKEGDGFRATGVRVILNDGSVFEPKADKEVIVSGGAYCSPVILNRSGIGAKDELEKYGIGTLVDLPGVGKNLMDHLIVFLMYETEKPGLTSDHQVYHAGAFEKGIQLWREGKQSALSSFGWGIVAFTRLDSRLSDSEVWNSASRGPGRDPMGLTPSQPNAELMTTERFLGLPPVDRQRLDGRHVFGFLPELFGARSRGTVALRSADAKALPVVDCGFLTDRLDVEVFAEVCRLANEVIMSGAGTKDIVKGPWPPEATHHKLSTREDWIPFIKENATTCYHASGTCAMGRDSNPKAVVDENLKVKGVKGLRVVDCSIMPSLPCCHSQMPAYGIGEKAADLIKGDWRM